jgi:hypothetical protein
MGDRSRRRRKRARWLAAMPPHDVFHPVFEMQFAFLESDFFDLLWF